MAHIGRSVKNVEAPRPLKSQSRSSLKNNFMLIEELIQLLENVAISLQSGINNTEPMATLVQNLRIHGPQLETISKDTLDRAFVVFRNASQDERLNIMTRLNLLELIELRAKGWEDNGINAYYKTKQATNAELNDVQNHVDPTQTAFLSTSPTFGGVNAGGNAAAAAVAAAIASVGSANQQHMLLSPGEVIRNSGKFPKPTKIPGKTYCKDEVVIRNADSGKVMGIKGRRVHMIEELSETIISFQRVNPGAKERLVQITGPAEDKINYAKQLIEDTIRRNASPVRLDPAMGGHAGGSCSSLASSNSDEPVQPRTPGASSNLSNRLSFNSAQNFMTAAAASQQMVQHQQHQQPQHMPNMQGLTTSTPVANAVAAAAAAGKPIRPHSQMLLHSYSTNDASVDEFKFTCNVGQHVIKITGGCFELVRVAKLVLDDYFSSAEFLASVEAGASFDGSMASPISTPTTPMTGPPQFAMGTPLHGGSPLATDSGIGLNYMSSANSNHNQDIDDDVFVDGNNLSKSASQSNGLARSRRSHFSRKDSTPEAVANNAVTSTVMRQKSEPGTSDSNTISEATRIVHQYEHLLYYAKSPHSWALPTEWQKICEKFPAIIRNKVTTTSATTHASTATTLTNLTTTPSYSSSSSTIANAPTTKASSLTLRVACYNAAHSTFVQNMTTTTNATNTTTTTTTASSLTLDSNSTTFTHNNSTIIQPPPPSSTIATTSVITNNISVNNNNSLSTNYNNHHHHYHTNSNSNSNNNNQTYNDFSNVNGKSIESNSSSTAYKLNYNANLSLNIRRKGFFNRLTYSIDEDGYEAAMKTATSPPIVEPPTHVPTAGHYTHNLYHNSTNITAGSGRIHSAGLNHRHISSVRTGPLTSMPLAAPNGEHPLAPNEAHTRQKLLHKQIKFISDIMVESSKSSNTNKSNENLKSNYDNHHKINNDDEDDDDDVVEIVSVSPATTTVPVTENSNTNSSSIANSTNMRPKLNYEFRSYSTCD